ncbi:MAG TPA: hypothetical protein VLY45_03855 [Nitrospiria bacterium]|nr:hypothetical protein [Nitrospiria bacterium]
MGSRHYRIVSSIGVIVAAFVVCGCGGNSGGSSLSGTAAAGEPMSNAVVTVKDRNGMAKTGTTDANGRYHIDVPGLTAPYLLKLDPPSGPSLFSVGIQTGTVNIHPFTDLIIRTWYQLNGLQLDDAFAAMGGSTPVPTGAEIEAVSTMVKGIVWRALMDQGINPAPFDLITTPFVANGTGFDAVLGASQINSNTTVIVQDSNVSQTSVLTSDAPTSTLNVNTETTAGPSSTMDVTAAIIPTTPELQTAVDGVSATLSHVLSVARASGSLLSAADLTGDFDTNYLQDGFGIAIGTAELATLLRSVSANLLSITIDRILSYDALNKVMVVTVTLSWTDNGQILYRIIDRNGTGIGFRQQGDGAWRFFGDQRLAGVQAQAMMVQTMAGQPTDGASQLLQLQVIAPAGSVVSAQASNGSATFTLSKSSTLLVTTYYPSANTPETVNQDVFTLYWPIIPSIGTTFTFTITTGGGDVSYVDVLQAATTESIQMTNPTGHALADALLGQWLPVAWTLPVSFPIGEVDLSGVVSAGLQSCNVYNPFPGPSSTTGNIFLPTTCGAAPVVPGVTPGGADPAILQLKVRGINGEVTMVQYSFT